MVVVRMKQRVMVSLISKGTFRNYPRRIAWPFKRCLTLQQT